DLDARPLGGERGRHRVGDHLDAQAAVVGAVEVQRGLGGGRLGRGLGLGVGVEVGRGVEHGAVVPDGGGQVGRVGEGLLHGGGVAGAAVAGRPVVPQAV